MGYLPQWFHNLIDGYNTEISIIILIHGHCLRRYGSPPSHVIIPRTSHFLSEGTAGSVCWWGRILWNSVQKIRNEPPKWPCWAMLNSEGYPNVGGRDDFSSLLLPPGAKVKALLRENPLEDQPAPTVRHTQQRWIKCWGNWWNIWTMRGTNDGKLWEHSNIL